MPRYSLVVLPTAQRMVSHFVTWSGARWAGAVGGVDWDSEAVLQTWYKLCRSEVESKSPRVQESKVLLCISCPLPNKTKLKFDEYFKACWDELVPKPDKNYC